MFLLVLAACTSAPESIRVDDPMLVFEPSPQTLDLAALDAEGEVLEDVKVEVGVAGDPEVLAVGKDGRVRCAGTGASSLELTAGGVKRTIQVQCALVKEVRVMPAALSHVLVPEKDGSFEAASLAAVKAEVIGDDDQITQAVEVHVNSSDEGVIKVGEDKSLQAVGPGKAIVRYMAGDKVTELPIEVAEEVLREVDLKVASRDQHGFPLPAGTYRATAGADFPVSLSFAGTDCETERSKTPTLECTLDKTATVVVENNPGFSLGDDASVKLRVLKLP